LAEGLDAFRRLLPVAADVGLAVLSGSDLAVPSSGIGREAIALIELGLPPDRAVSGLSDAAYAASGRPVGFVPGRPADLVGFRAHPIEVPSVLAEPVVVMRRGRLVADRRA
jgi:imidazolonepropionase-like amidohydrolase